MPSSVIKSFAYRPADRELDVRFVSGRRYVYHDVSPDVAGAMRGAPSKGSYFNEHVRDHFRFTRERGEA